MADEKSLSDLIDKIAKKIPGFGGYYRKEERREDDNRLRQSIFNKLDRVTNILNEKGRKITNSGNLKPLSRVEQIRKRLEKLRDSIRYASYGYSGFFDIKEVSEGTLIKVYEFDFKMLEWVDDFLMNLNVDTDIEEILKEIEKGFKILNDRTKIIEGV